MDSPYEDFAAKKNNYLTFVGKKSQETDMHGKLVKPKNSRAVLEPTADGFRVALPPVGISRAGHGSFWVGLIFCAGVALISVCFVLLSSSGQTHKGVFVPPKPVPWQMWAGMGGFGVVSIGITLFGLSMGVRRALIEVSGDSLRIHEKGLFVRRHREWTRGELRAIQSGPSGFSVGRTKKSGRSGAAGESIYQLHIYLNDRRRIRCLTGRNADELDWIAEQLRNALTVSTTEYDGG